MLCGHQEKATYGSGYKLTLTRTKDDALLNKAPGIADARIKIDNTFWYVPHYTPHFPQQGILSEQILSKTILEIRYNERSVFMNEGSDPKLCNFKLVIKESMKVPIWINVGFQRRHRQGSQNPKKDTYYKLPITGGEVITGTEKNLILAYC